MKKKKKRKKISNIEIFTLIIISIGAFFMFLPYAWMILTSFKSNQEIFQHSNRIIPMSFTLEGYKTVLTDSPFLKWLFNSMLISVVITSAVLLTSTLSGYIFAKFKFKGKKTLFLITLGTMMVPFQIMLIPRYILISELKLLDNLMAVILPGLVSAFGIYLSKQFIENLPDSMIEAAKIDGASEFKIYRKIILPSIKPAISSLAIFTFMASWNDYLWPLIVLNDIEKMTVPLALSFFNGRYTVNYNVIMSAAVLIMIPVFIVFLIFQKQFIKGLTLSGTKG